jgi:hypothetical protein
VHQRLQVLTRACDELAANRRLRGRARLGLNRLTHRLLRAPVAPRRHTGEHPLQHRLGQRIAVGEVRVGLQRQLDATVGAPDARPLDRNPTAAERHLAGLVAVAHRRARGVVPALRPDHLVDLLFHQLDQHPQADADAERQQPLPRRPDELSQRFLHPHRQHRLRGGHDLPERYG